MALLALLLLGLAALAWWFFHGRRGNDGVPRFPGAHLILISVDTLRRDAVGIYSGRPQASPALDKLAREGIVFGDAVAASNNTGPSHASMLTGMSAAVHGVLNAKATPPRLIPSTLPTMAERLQEAGYATVGRADSGYVTSVFGFQRGFDDFKSEYTGLFRKLPETLAFFEKHAAAKPIFAFLHTYEVHSPYLSVPQRAAGAMKGFEGTEVARRVNSLVEDRVADRLSEGQKRLFDNWKAKFTTRDFEALKALYAECVKTADSRIGAFVEDLRRRGILDQCILVVTSDHGEEFGEHGSVQHEECWEELLRVPLIVRLPGGALAGTRVRAPISGVDLMPTLLDLLGLPLPTRIEGRSAVPAILRETVLDPITYSHHTSQDMMIGAVARTPEWKVYDFDNRPQWARAFHLVKDPTERDNLSKAPPSEAQELLRTLKARRDVWRAMGALHDSGRSTGVMDQELLDQLDSLGYTR